MVRVIIVDDNIILGVNLFNLLNDTKELKVEKLICNGSEVIDQIKASAVDLLILDLNLPEKSGIEIIEEIERDESINTKVIVYSGDAEYIAKLRIYDCVIKFINKCVDYSSLKLDIMSIAKEIEGRQIERKAMQFLLSSGFSMINKGTYYLRDSIIVYSLSKEDDCKIKEIFVEVANINASTPKKIESNVYNTTYAMWHYANKEFVRKKFQLNFDEDITPKRIITMGRYYIEQ